MPRHRKRRRPRPAHKPVKRKSRSFSWPALVVVLALAAALVLLPIARHLGLTRFDAGDVTERLRSIATPGGPTRDDPASGTGAPERPTRSDNALPPCPEGTSWTPERHAGLDEEPPHDDPAAEDAEDLADAATNAARREHGLAELSADETLREIARRHSEDMAERGFFSHDDPGGRSPGDRVHDGHRTLVGEVGENIWMCRGCWEGDAGAAADTIVNGEKGWMHSPGHRANILRESFTHAAVGIAQRGSDLWATQVFASARGWIFSGVPRELAVGDCLLLEVTPHGEDGVEAAAFDLVRLPSMTPVRDATPLGFNRLDVDPGNYRLRFHFPLAGRRFEIVSGPNVWVR